MKKNLSVAVVVVVLLTLAVGYALFSQTINITGTATAQGNFEITTTCDPGIVPADLRSHFSSDIVTEKGYTNDLCEPVSSATSQGNSTVSFQVNLLYPGATRYFTIKMTNTGSITAALNENTGFSITHERCNDANKNGTFETSECASDNSNSWFSDTGFAFKRGTTYYSVEDENTGFFDEDGNLILKPGETAYVAFIASFPDEELEAQSFNYRETMTIHLNFEQYNQ